MGIISGAGTLFREYLISRFGETASISRDFTFSIEIGKYEKGGIKFREEFFSRVILQFFSNPDKREIKDQRNQERN